MKHAKSRALPRTANHCQAMPITAKHCQAIPITVKHRCASMRTAKHRRSTCRPQAKTPMLAETMQILASITEHCHRRIPSNIPQHSQTALTSKSRGTPLLGTASLVLPTISPLQSWRTQARSVCSAVRGTETGPITVHVP